MQRRNLLIGMGSIAAGGAATIGTGAFTSVTAQREIQLAIQADGDGAYLDFDASTSDYADTSGGTLRLTFDSNGGADTGMGLTSKANTLFEEVFQIYNNGTNEVEVSLPTVESPRDDPASASTQFLVDEADAGNDPIGYQYDADNEANSFDSDYVDISWDPNIPAFNKPSNPVPKSGRDKSREDRVLTSYKGKRYPGGSAVIPSGESVGIHVRFTISNKRSEKDRYPESGTAPLVFEAEESSS